MVRNSLKGFTLIELLVTVSIIAILSAIGLTTYQGTQSAARDSVRKNDLNKLATALELYSQKNGHYPLPQSAADSCSRDTPSFYKEIAQYISGDVPKDPKTGSQYCYIAVNNGQSFRLFTKLENASDPDRLTNCPATSLYDYTIVSVDLTTSCPP